MEPFDLESVDKLLGTLGDTAEEAMRTGPIKRLLGCASAAIEAGQADITIMALERALVAAREWSSGEKLQ